MAATKLGLGAVEDWVEQEVNGYKDELPIIALFMVSLGGPVKKLSVRHSRDVASRGSPEIMMMPHKAN
jgi:hypothetical protein